MEGSGQQQQPPTVVIVQQPMVVGNGSFVRGQPFLRRGVKLNNGTNIGVSCISCLGVTGAVLTFMGIIFTFVGISVFVGILMLLAGGGMLAACFKFCHKAKQDYDALPQDHPDRVTYSTPVFRPHRGGGPFPITTTTATYQLPPGTQIINTSSVQGAPQFLGGQVVNTPSMSAALATASYPRMSYHQPEYPGVIPPQFQKQFNPQEDKPPSYDEVCKASATNQL